jgi:hypothetical protein
MGVHAHNAADLAPWADSQASPSLIDASHASPILTAQPQPKTVYGQQSYGVLPVNGSSKPPQPKPPSAPNSIGASMTQASMAWQNLSLVNATQGHQSMPPSVIGMSSSRSMPTITMQKGLFLWYTETEPRTSDQIKDLRNMEDTLDSLHNIDRMVRDKVA